MDPPREYAALDLLQIFSFENGSSAVILFVKDYSCLIMSGKKKRTSDAIEILQRRYYEGKPSRIAQVEQQRADDEIARQIYALREKAGLTQKRLAELVGTTPSVISRLEDSDYESHSLTMLK